MCNKLERVLQWALMDLPWILPFASYSTCSIVFVCIAPSSPQSTFFRCISELITDIIVFPLNTYACNQNSIFVYRFFFLWDKICLHWDTSIHLLNFDKCIHLGTLNNYRDTQLLESSVMPLPSPPHPLHCPNACVLMLFLPKLVCLFKYSQKWNNISCTLLYVFCYSASYVCSLFLWCALAIYSFLLPRRIPLG